MTNEIYCKFRTIHLILLVIVACLSFYIGMFYGNNINPINYTIQDVCLECNRVYGFNDSGYSVGSYVFSVDDCLFNTDTQEYWCLKK